MLESTLGPIGTVNRLSLAITVDKTNVVYDVETHSFREMDRHEKEIKQLEQLAKQVERREFWIGLVINFAKIGFILFTLMVMRRIFLLLGASRVCRHCSSSEVLQTS